MRESPASNQGHAQLADNWTFQDAGELLTHGITGGCVPILEIPANAKSHRLGKTAVDVIRVEALAQVITDVVLSDVCFVDAGNTDAWLGRSSLDLLAEKGLVVPKDFTPARENWLPIRESIESKLCFLKSLELEHEANKKHYIEKGRTANETLGTVLWGGAGMLARAQYSGLPYTSHPLRRQLLVRAGVLLAPPSATQTLERFLESNSTTMVRTTDDSGFWARVRLPSVFSEVVEESRCIEDIVPIAIQLRDKYAGLRSWLAEFQVQLDSGDRAGVAARKRTLEGVARGIDASLISATGNAPSVQLNLGLVRVTYNPTGLLDKALNWFGIRAQIATLIRSSAGINALDRLVAFMGESRSGLGHEFKQQWTNRITDTP